MVEVLEQELADVDVESVSNMGQEHLLSIYRYQLSACGLTEVEFLRHLNSTYYNLPSPERGDYDRDHAISGEYAVREDACVSLTDDQRICIARAHLTGNETDDFVWETPDTVARDQDGNPRRTHAALRAKTEILAEQFGAGQRRAVEKLKMAGIADFLESLRILRDGPLLRKAYLKDQRLRAIHDGPGRLGWLAGLREYATVFPLASTIRELHAKHHGDLGPIADCIDREDQSGSSVVVHIPAARIGNDDQFTPENCGFVVAYGTGGPQEGDLQFHPHWVAQRKADTGTPVHPSDVIDFRQGTPESARDTFTDRYAHFWHGDPRSGFSYGELDSAEPWKGAIFNDVPLDFMNFCRGMRQQHPRIPFDILHALYRKRCHPVRISNRYTTGRGSCAGSDIGLAVALQNYFRRDDFAADADQVTAEPERTHDSSLLQPVLLGVRTDSAPKDRFLTFDSVCVCIAQDRGDDSIGYTVFPTWQGPGGAIQFDQNAEVFKAQKIQSPAACLSGNSVKDTEWLGIRNTRFFRMDSGPPAVDGSVQPNIGIDLDTCTLIYTEPEGQHSSIAGILRRVPGVERDAVSPPGRVAYTIPVRELLEREEACEQLSFRDTSGTGVLRAVTQAIASSFGHSGYAIDDLWFLIQHLPEFAEQMNTSVSAGRKGWM